MALYVTTGGQLAAGDRKKNGPFPTKGRPHAAFLLMSHSLLICNHFNFARFVTCAHVLIMGARAGPRLRLGL